MDRCQPNAFAPLLRSPSRASRLLLIASLALAALSLPRPASAVSLSELLAHPTLTPKKFALYFETFRYRLHRDVQPPDEFLGKRVGDCDDYACLADYVLPRKGYETRLVHVRLAGMTDHAVCYVTEDRAYLDYNNRDVFFSMTRARPSLRHIAEKVARSLDANWTSASEFVFSYETGNKTITATVVATDDPANDPPPRKAPPPANRLLVD